MDRVDQPWRVPVRLDDVPDEGRHFELVADAGVRAAVARVAGLVELPRLAARLDVSRRGRDGLRVLGEVSATVVQTCVVTLEPLVNQVSEPVDVLFLPEADAAARPNAAEDPAGPEEGDPPEPLVGGAVDLGAIAVEFLLVGLDPYPRKPDATFSAPAPPDAGGNPFAALAALKERAGRKE